MISDRADFPLSIRFYCRFTLRWYLRKTIRHHLCRGCRCCWVNWGSGNLFRPSGRDQAGRIRNPRGEGSKVTDRTLQIRLAGERLKHCRSVRPHTGIGSCWDHLFRLESTSRYRPSPNRLSSPCRILHLGATKPATTIIYISADLCLIFT